MDETRRSIAVLISGGGRTLRNLIEHCDSGRLPAKIALAVSSNRDARGNQFANEAGIPLHVLDHREFRTASLISPPIFDACRMAGVELVVLGGFLRRLEIPTDFAGRVINIHPSLLPAYGGKGMYGLRVHEAVLAAGESVSGCSVHFVDNEYDHGQVIARQQVEVRPDDTAETLADRVFAAECELYPRVIGTLLAGNQ